MNERAVMGGNSPPSNIDFSRETVAALDEFLKNHPVIESPEDAKEGKLLADRAANSLKDMEAERDGLVRPLNEQVAEINATFRQPKQTLEKVANILKGRLTVFIQTEKRRRETEAEAKRKAAEEAERIAREAEEREREAKEDAAAGVIEAPVVEAAVSADLAFSEFKRAEREANRAERDAEKTKIAGGFNKALALRTKEILTVSDWQAAIEEMGCTDRIKEAILTDARSYRKEFNELPAGIAISTEEVL